MAEKNSIAIWCEKAEHAGKAEAEIHVNLWHFSDIEREDFFEIGIMPDDPNDLECIKIFLPIQVTYDEIQDLGPQFKSTEIAQGIFNETLSCKLSEDRKCVELCEGDKIFCQVHIFSTNKKRIDKSELSLNEIDDGTLLTIRRQALESLDTQSSSTETGYFRLRITPSDRTAPLFLTVIEPEDRAWHSGFGVIEYIDCRVNEARTLPVSIESAFRAAKHGAAKTRLIAFLAVIPVVSSITSSHTEWHKSRLLERQIWDDYVPHGLEEGMVVYHWKKCFDFEEIKDKRFASFSAFVKMQTRKSGRLIITLYLFLAFVLCVLGSLAASAILHLFSGSD